MFTPLFSVLIQAILNVLKDVPNFFELSADERKEKVDALQLPVSLVAYLSKAKEAEFMVDLANLTAYFQKASGVVISDNKMAIAFAEYLTTEFAALLDELNQDFYQQDSAAIREALTKLVKGKQAFAQAVRETCATASYEELASASQAFLVAVQATPLVIVQTPVALTVAQRQEIRAHLNQEQKVPSLPMFQVNRNLIGGLRLFVDGQVTDHSWMGRINYVASLQI